MSTAPNTSRAITATKPLPFCAVTIPEKTTNRATPTPSLSSDSPSIRKPVSFGSPNLFRMLVAAIGSVGAVTLPNIRQTGRLNGRFSKMEASLNRTPYRSAPRSVQTNASTLTCLACSLNCDSFNRHEPANSIKHSTPFIRNVSMLKT